MFRNTTNPISTQCGKTAGNGRFQKARKTQKRDSQALVYSLTVASKASTAARRNAANKILNKIRDHSATLVDQAMMVSNELIRVAILWHEQWHEGLEEVHYFMKYSKKFVKE